MRKKLLRLLWVAPVAMLLFAGSAIAQSTGTIVGVVTDAASGKPVAGALIIATSKSLQGEQTAVTGTKGDYTLVSLPPGIYTLNAQLAGYKPATRGEINLRVDFTIRANIAIVPEAVQMEEQVVKTGLSAPAVNVGSAEAGTIVSKEFMASVPTSRTFEQVATIAPTAVRDAYGVSFAGATSPENNYIIDGLRVSDPSVGTLGTNLLTNFVDQLDVKVGSFMPEYGYSSAGIINTVTKSGGNEFHGSIWGNITPGFFTPSTPAISNAGQALALQSTPYKGSYNTDFGFELGGPIAKDKVWFYVGFAPQFGYTANTRYVQSRNAAVAGSPSITVPVSSTTPNAASGAGTWLADQYGQFVMSPVAGTEQDWTSGFNRYFGIAKLTWLINENNNVWASFNTQPTNTYGAAGFSGNASAVTVNSDSNTTNATLNYTGKFLDKHLLAEVHAGWYNNTLTYNNQTLGGVGTLTTPNTSWRTSRPLTFFADLPAGVSCATGACVVTNYATGGIGYYDNPKNNRYAGNAALTALFDLAGQHQLKGGAQIEYSTYDNDRHYTGNAALRVRNSSTSNSNFNSVQIFRAYGNLDPNQYKAGSTIQSASWCTSITTDANGNKVCVNPGGVDPSIVATSSATTNTWTNGFYLQDSWTIANVLTLNFGVRLDTQKMQSPTWQAVDATSPVLNITNEWAPRVQAIWDFTGTGRGKVSANWGMYYESIPLDMALRAFGAEQQIRGAYKYSTCTGVIDPKANPGFNGLAQCAGSVYGNAQGAGIGAGLPGGGNIATLPAVSLGNQFALTSTFYSPLAPDLKGMYTQQFGGGVQYEVLQDLTVGVDYLGRRVGNIIEDMSSDDGSNYFIANPTVSQPWTVAAGPYKDITLNPMNAAGLSASSGNIYTVNWPAPTRSYDAFSVTVNKLFSKKWLAQASYTWSSLRGNFPGLFRAENGQLDPNITSEYDLVSLLGNKSGPLNGNRANQIKLAGSYNATLSPEVTLVPSINFQAFSGAPVSATGCHPLYGCGEAYILPRGVVGDLNWTIQADLGAKLIWAIAGPYTLQFSLDIFNVLNMQTVQNVDMLYANGSADFLVPIQGAQCSSKTSATAKNPITALQAACPDLPYLQTIDGRRPTVNLNFGRPVSYQSPISARFGVQLSF